MGDRKRTLSNVLFTTGWSQELSAMSAAESGSIAARAVIDGPLRADCKGNHMRTPGSPAYRDALYFLRSGVKTDGSISSVQMVVCLLLLTASADPARQRRTQPTA